MFPPVHMPPPSLTECHGNDSGPGSRSLDLRSAFLLIRGVIWSKSRWPWRTSSPAFKTRGWTWCLRVHFTSPWILTCHHPPAENNHLFPLLFLSLLMKAKLDLCNKRSFWLIELHNHLCCCSSPMTHSPWVAPATPRRLHLQTLDVNLVTL